MVEYEESGTLLRCVFSGKLDTLACQSFETGLANRVRRAPGAVEFDLAAVFYVSSSFLRLCIQTAKERSGSGFAVVNPSPDVQKVLVIAGLDKLVRF